MKRLRYMNRTSDSMMHQTVNNNDNNHGDDCKVEVFYENGQEFIQGLDFKQYEPVEPSKVEFEYSEEEVAYESDYKYEQDSGSDFYGSELDVNYDDYSSGEFGPDGNATEFDINTTEGQFAPVIKQDQVELFTESAPEIQQRKSKSSIKRLLKRLDKTLTKSEELRASVQEESITTNISTIVSQELCNWYPTNYCNLKILIALCFMVFGIFLCEYFGFTMIESILSTGLAFICTLFTIFSARKIVDDCKIRSCPRTIAPEAETN